MTTTPTRRVLISGASIAGPALAYWLHHFGLAVTVVERAPQVRSGGYPIDLRGVAIDVVDRMRLLPRLRRAHISTRTVTFIDGDGRPVNVLKAEAFNGTNDERDLEVPRGDLITALYELTRDDVEYVFNDSIAVLDNRDDGVDVTFDQGGQRTFDLVLGADGLHSNVRELAFGPEPGCERYLGWCFAGFTAPNHLALSHEVLTYNTPGRMAALYGVRDQPTVHAILAYARPQPTRDELRDVDRQCELLADAFAGAGWEIPWMLDALRQADDVFSDTISQIAMPTWSAGRVALVGDAGYAASFLSGQGSSLAVVGAYVLAGEIAHNTDHRTAFARYERALRDFVVKNQKLALGASPIIPSTRRQLWMRDRLMAALPLLTRLGITNLLGGATRRAATALELPAYGPPVTRAMDEGEPSPSS